MSPGLSACPNCGAPVETTVPEKKNRDKGPPIGCVGVILASFVLMAFIGIVGNWDDTPSTTSPTPSARSSKAKSGLPTGQHRIAKSGNFGCIDKGDLDDLVGYATSGDRAAFSSALGAGVATGRCTMFESGEIVFLEKSGFTTIRIRRKAGTTKYWTVRETIDK